MSGGLFDVPGLADDRRLLPGDARGIASDGDIRARRPERGDVDIDDPYSVSGRRSSFAAADSGTMAGASFSSARVERALAAVDHAPPSSASTSTSAPSLDIPVDAAVAGSAFDPLTLLRDRAAAEPAGDDAAPATTRGARLHPLFMRGMDRSDQGPRLDARQRRHVGDGVVAPDPMLAESGRGTQELESSDLDFVGMRPITPSSADVDPAAKLMRQQARIPMYRDRPSFDDRDLALSDAEHPLFAARAESPSTYGAPAIRPSSTSPDLYEVPGRRASFIDEPRREGMPDSPAPDVQPPAAARPKPGAKRSMSMSSDDDFDPEWMNGKVPASYYDSLGLPLGGHYMDTRRHHEWNRRAAARPKPQPARRWWQKLGSLLRGRGWR